MSNMGDSIYHSPYPERDSSLPPSFQTWKTAQTKLPKRDSGASYHSEFRQSLVPAPLNPRPVLQTFLEDADESPTQLPARPIRVYGGAASKVKEYFGADEVTVDFSHLKPFPENTSLRPAPRTWRSSLYRLSLTPSEMPYPINLHRTYAEGGDTHSKAEEMLGVRRVQIAPPVPPKDPRRSRTSASTTSDLSLPLHKSDKMQLDYPEHPLNGRTAWLHSLTGMLVVFNCWGFGNAFGLFEAYYSTVMLPNTSPSAIAWIGSTQLALVFGLGVPVGRLLDRGYFSIIFRLGTVIMIGGLFLTAACKSLWSLWLVNGLMTGIGMGMTFTSGIVALMTWFDETKIGAALGLGATGSCLGGIVYVLLARHLLATKGFHTTMLVLGAVAAVTMIPPLYVFRVRGQRHRSIRELLRGRRSRGRRAKTSKPKFSWRTFADPSYLLAAGGLFLAFLGVYFGFVYMPLYGSTVLHLSDTASTNLLIFMLAANLPGRLLPGLISDRCLGPLNTIIPSVFLSSAVIWLWTASGEGRGSLIVIACFYGFVSAGIQALYAPTIYAFCLEPVRTSTMDKEQDTQLAMDRVGVRAGGIFTLIGVACLIGLPVGGALISHRTDTGLSHPFLGAQIFSGVCLLVGGVLLLASRVKKNGWAPGRA